MRLTASNPNPTPPGFALKKGLKILDRSSSIGRVSFHPFEFLQADFFRAIPLPATQVRIAISQNARQVSAVFSLLIKRASQFITNSHSLPYHSTHYTQTDDNRCAAEVAADAAHRSPGVFGVSFNCPQIGPQSMLSNTPQRVRNLT